MIIGKTEVVDAPKPGRQKPQVLDEIDEELGAQLETLTSGQELRVWIPVDAEFLHVCKLESLVKSYLRKHWPKLRVRRNVGADFVRIGYMNESHHGHLRSKMSSTPDLRSEEEKTNGTKG